MLHCGDALTILKQIPDGAADLIVADPPYGTTKLAWDQGLDWPALWPELHRVTRPTATILLFAAPGRCAADLLNSNREAFRYELTWMKTRATGFLDANCRPLRVRESILLFCQSWRGKGNRLVATFNPQKTPGDPYMKQRTGDRRGNRQIHYGSSTDPFRPTINASGERYPQDVLRFPSGNNGAHPTAKPVDLVRWLLRSYSNTGEVVLDFCMGGGTTGEACALEDRQFIGIERDKIFFNQAAERLAMLVPGNKSPSVCIKAVELSVTENDQRTFNYSVNAP